jgi:uncharacterized protein YodC (DUF2158 family)
LSWIVAPFSCRWFNRVGSALQAAQTVDESGSSGL